MNRRSLLAVCALWPACAVHAQPPYPNQPVRWIVPFAAGGGTDNIARVLADVTQRSLGQPIVIDNRPGAATNIGVTALLQSKPDGYTVMQAENGALLFNEHLFARLPYHPDRDFTYIGGIGRLPVVLTVHPSVPARSVAEFVAYAKAQNGKLSYASAGLGTPHHMAMELFKQQAGFQATHVPYRGAAPAIQDMLGGQVKVMMVDLASALQYLRTGKLQALAIASERRARALPDVPSFAEAGHRDINAHAFQGLIGPAGLPPEVTARLNAEINKALVDPKLVELFANYGFESIADTPEAFRTTARNESARWGKVISAAGIRLD